MALMKKNMIYYNHHILLDQHILGKFDIYPVHYNEITLSGPLARAHVLKCIF